MGVHRDDDAYARWLTELRPQLLRYARQQLRGDTAEAEDVVQEASMRALVALRDGRVPANPRAWMYVIVRNRCHDVRGARRPSEPLDDALGISSTAPGPDEEAAARRQLGAVVDAIGELPEAQRRALVSATFEGRAYEEIAVRESTSVQAVKSLVHRARRGLEASGARAAALMPFGLREQIAGFFTQHGAAAASVAAVAVAVPVVPVELHHAVRQAPKTAAKRAAPLRASAVSVSAAVSASRSAPTPAAAARGRAAAAALVAVRRACAARAATEAEYGGGCAAPGGVKQTPQDSTAPLHTPG
jgi:RNA polymerase sigma factor (sigma-70 family)